MKRNSVPLILCAVLAIGTPTVFPHATFGFDSGTVAPAAGQMEALVVGKVKVNDSVTEGSREEGRANKLSRISEAMATQFTAALGGTRKFKIIAGADLPEIMKQHTLKPLENGNDPNAPQVGNLRPPKYVVVPTIDDFQDVAENMQDEGHDPVASARRIRISVVATIYDINTGEVKETLNTQVNERKVTKDIAGVHATGDSKDDLLMVLTQRAANQSANRVLDVFFPAKIISHVDKTVSLNRGDGTSIQVGQVWDSYALGDEMKDPDTGEVLGRQEVASGKIRVTAVYPKFSQAEIIEDTGIDKGNIVRMHPDKSQADEKNH